MSDASYFFSMYAGVHGTVNCVCPVRYQNSVCTQYYLGTCPKIVSTLSRADSVCLNDARVMLHRRERDCVMHFGLENVKADCKSPLD